MKRLMAVVFCAIMIATLGTPVFATNITGATQPPPWITLNEGEVWISASEENGPMLREAPNAACKIASHIPPSSYRYVGRKDGDTRVDNIYATLGGLFVSLITPDLGILAGIVGLGIAIGDLDSTVHGTYSEYSWEDGRYYFKHIVGYARFSVNGFEYADYVNCEVKTGRF